MLTVTVVSKTRYGIRAGSTPATSIRLGVLKIKKRGSMTVIFLVGNLELLWIFW